MRRIIILTLVSVAAGPAWARPDFGGGVGFETRLQREVNPEFAEAKSHPHVFAQMLFVNWGAHLEVSTETQSSTSGALVINSRSLNTGAWGRYKFLAEKRWRPFASAGVGMFFDRVKSEFGAAVNESEGNRAYMGFGGGLSAVFWNHLLIEGEARATVVRERKEPMVSALLRIGFLF